MSISLSRSLRRSGCGRFALMLAAASCLGLWAQTPPAPSPVAEQAAANAPAKLGSWWERSSLSYPTVPTEFLFHGTGNLHYRDAEGNTSGTVFGGGVSLTFRKLRFTDSLIETLEKNNLTYAFNSGSAHFTQNTVLNQLDFDISKTVMAVGGIEDYRNTMIFIDRRLTEYAGLGYTPEQSERFSLNLIGAAGYSNFLFDATGINAINPAIVPSLPMLSPGSAGGVIMNNLHLAINPAVSLDENASFMKYTNSILGHRWEVAVNLTIPIAKRLSIQPGYQIKEESNIYTTALRVKPQDRTFNLGLGIQF